MSDNKHFETKAIRTQTERSQQREHATPLYMTSSFVFNNAEQMRAMFADEIQGNIYSRFVNPSVKEFEDKMALLECAEDALATSSGMAAMFNSMAALLNAGDHIVACRSLFGSTHTVITKFLPKWNIDHTYVDLDQTDIWESAIQSNTKMVVIETPTNPTLDIIDLEWLGKLCKDKGVLLLVDNCFATPYIQNPIKFGADLVIHSATKYIDGQGRGVGGVITGSKELLKEIKAFCRSTGPTMSPFNAWMFSKSLETLSIRMEKHSSNALQLANWLENIDDVKIVSYPFLKSYRNYEIAKKQMSLGGGIVTFEIEGGVSRGRKFLDEIQMCSMTANLGDSRTIVSHPSSTTHAKLTEEERLAVGIQPGLIRVSVGLENIEDIKQDILNAINNSK
jgi:O-succinylhomoserine sulfhydrylase